MTADAYKRRLKLGAGLAGALLLGVSGVALGLPWDIDMADSQAIKAYSRPMRALPEGVVAQDNLLSPKGHDPNEIRGSAAAGKLLAPRVSEERLELGGRMYNIYCTPCHGADGIELGPVAASAGAPDRFAGIVQLAGPNGVARDRDNNWIYLTIRNGGPLMPAYGHAMSDEEMWAVVHYVRTLEGAEQAPADGSEGEAVEPAEGNP